MTTSTTNDLFPSLISDIKSYSGNDPLLPWLRGVKKLRDSLPPQLLTEKLPRFLQKCAQTFQSDRRYRNDLRYLRIWLQLLDYVDDPKALLRTMEMKKIGIKRALFYQAYALYYEKVKKFDDADNMYRLGVQNLAEPMDKLQKSYEQFVQRVEWHKTKKERRTTKRPLSDRSTTHLSGPSKENPEKSSNRPSEGLLLKGSTLKKGLSSSKHVLTEGSQNLMPLNEVKPGNPNKLCRDDSVVAKFVDSAIVGMSEAEDACHHGLVEPTVNMKEAMNAINSMFLEPIETANVVQRSSKGLNKEAQRANNVLEVFVDERSSPIFGTSCQKDEENILVPQKKSEEAIQEPLQIFSDDESSNDSEPSELQTSTDGSPSSSSRVDEFVFLRPNDNQLESSNEMKVEQSLKNTRTLFREDTVVCRFVGSAILDEPEVENICHHGLVDPTVNLKEAMEDINGMFGKPIDFVRTTRRKRQEQAATSGKHDNGGFSILADDDLDTHENQQPPQISTSKDKYSLHEPTVFTKEAMDDINNLFSMPLDF